MKASSLTRNNRIALMIGVAISAVASSHPVYAQDVTADDVQTEEADAPAEAIVVTGSRIAKPNLESTAPIGIITSEALDTRGFTSVAQALNELPSFGVPGASPVGFGQSGFGAGQSFVDFLGLGSQRTLTLVNGRRFVSSNTSSIFGPTGSGGSQVDLNNIPTKLVDRIETVAAIGAPVYGSDAIAGTINIILKRDFEGIDIDAQYGISRKGDAADYRVRGLVGKNFADGRGNVTLSGEYGEGEGLLFPDRAVTASDDRFALARAANSPFRQVPYTDFRVPSVALTGIPLVGGAAFGLDFPLSSQQAALFLGDPTASFGVQNGALQTLKFDVNGNLTPIDFGSTIGPDSRFNVFTSGGNGLSLRDVENLLTDTKRYNAVLTTSYEISNSWRISAEGWYTVSEGRNLINQPAYNSALFGAAGSRDGNLIVPLSNPFLTPQVRTAIAEQINNNPYSDRNVNCTFGDPAPACLQDQNYFYLGRASIDLSPGTSVGKNEIFRVVADITGDFSIIPDKTWTFNASLNYGRAKTASRNQELNEQNFRNAVNAVSVGGNIVCAPGATNSAAPTVSSVCAPLNLFGRNGVTQAALDYVTSIATPVNINEQYDAIASISGPLFKLPGGDFGFALGYEHRQESSDFNPGVFYRGASTDLYPGVDYDSDGDPIDLFYGRSVPILPVFGKYNTDEVFGEINAPIVSPDNDVPLVSELSLNAAGRYVWNSIAGGDLTWTVGGRYAPLDGLTFRGAYTRAIRAPSVTELFNPSSSSFVFATDPCDAGEVTRGPSPATRAANCRAAGVPTNFTALSNQRSFPGFVFGNATLTNEKSDAFTAGVVFEPRFLRGLAITVDYVDITLKNAISQFSTDQVAASCYDSTTFPSNPFCTLVQRDPGTRQLSRIGTSFFNSAQLSYKGILADVKYVAETPFLGADSTVALSATYQYLDTLTNQVIAGDVPVQNNDTVGYSPHKGVFTATYENNIFNYQVQAQYLGATQVDPQATPDQFSVQKVDSVVFVNMAMSIDVTDRATFRLSADNVFNEKPPFPFPLAGGTTTYFSGILGTFFRAGFNVKY